MKRKSLLILLLAVIFTLPVMAQHKDTRTETHHSADTNDIGGEHAVGWMRSHTFDNWYIHLQGGGQLYQGYQDNQGPLADRLTGEGELFVGRWVFPMVGFRLGGGWGRSHGFCTRQSYDTYPLAFGYGESEGLAPTALGGYYWSYGDDNNLLIQKWDHLYAGGDIVLNFTNFKRYTRYNAARRWTNLGYAGVFIHHGLCEDHPEVPRSSDDNWAAEGHIGYIGKYFLTDHLGLFVDARIAVLEGRFDREYCEDIETIPQDFAFNLQAGLSYDFNLRSKAKRYQYYIDNGLIRDEGDNPSHNLPQFIHYVQLEEIEQIVIIDTIVKYATVYADDVRAIGLVDSLRNVLDSIVERQKRQADDQPLDSIFLKNLLPYEMVFFELDQWDILPSEEMKIAKMAKIIKAYPNEKFLLTGSADSKTGTVKRNIFLSHNRADVVYNKLVMEYDINPDQLVREYLGGVLDYDPFILNRTTVIIMDHPTVRKAFEEQKAQRKAGGNVVDF